MKETEWIKAGQAAQVMGIGRRAVSRLAYSGAISYRVLPGCKPVYALNDCKAVAAAAQRDAQGVSSTLGVVTSTLVRNV